MSKQPQEFVTEAVSAAKFAVRALATVCGGTLLLLSTGSNPDEQKQEAMAELEVLRNIDYQLELSKIVVEKHQSARSEVETLRNILRELELELSLSHGNVIALHTSPVQLERARNKTITLAEIDEVFESVRSVDGEARDIRQNSVNIRQSLESARVQHVAAEVPVSLTFSSGEEETELRMNAGEELLFQTVIKGRVEATDFSIPINLLRELSEVAELAEIVEQTTPDSFSFLPATKAFWREIRDRTIKEAQEYLARKEEPTAQTLNIFGLQFPKQHVSWVVPLIILGLSIYLWIYIQNIVANHRDGYPWIHLMETREALLVSVAMIGVLPAATLVLTAVATWRSTGWPIRIVSALCVAFSLFFLARSLSILPPVKSLYRACRGA